MSAVTLNNLKEGDRAVILNISGMGEFRRRLREMGFMPGSEVLVERYAPLRDPIELLVKGSHLSLRREEAKFVRVDLIT